MDAATDEGGRARLTFPPSPDSVSAEWLGAVLGARIDGVKIAPIGTDSGFAGAAHRLVPRYAGTADAESAPSSLIWKAPSAHAPTRRLLNRLGAYRAETDFYRRAAALSEIAPKPFFAEFDAGSGGFCLLLEDLSRMRRTDGFSREDAFAVARTLGRLHARFCSDSGRAAASWAPKFDGAAALFARLQTAAWRRMPPAILDAAPRLAETARRLAPRTAEIKARLARPPFTLIHGDARADNLFFDDDVDGGAPTVRAIDWQAVRLGRGGYDLAYFMATSLDAEVRRAIQDNMIRAYSDALTAAGCRCHSANSLREDVRDSLRDMVGFLGIIAATLDFGAGRGLELARMMMRRLDEALADDGLD